MQGRDKRDSNVSWSAGQRRVTKRTVAYQPAVSIRLSRSLGFPTCLFLPSPLSWPHERRPMASRKEQLSSLFFVAWTTRPLHEKLLMGFRRAKFTNRKIVKNIFVDDRLRGHHPRALKRSKFSEITNVYSRLQVISFPDQVRLTRQTRKREPDGS